jgi:hypothetical protein
VPLSGRFCSLLTCLDDLEALLSGSQAAFNLQAQLYFLRRFSKQSDRALVSPGFLPSAGWLLDYGQVEGTPAIERQPVNSDIASVQFVRGSELSVRREG